ncbi:MAG TPA: serine hydrolase [Gemmatimonadota bacterium]|nr:serine hydrolase [Gemmatimonadota bacterium]
MRRYVMVGGFLAAAFWTAAAHPQEAAHSQETAGGDWRADVEAFARRLVDAGLTPGMGIAVARGDSVAYVRGFGVADVESGRAVDEETAFYIASSTKALTGTAVALLAHRGELDLEAPVSRYIPAVAFEAPVDAESVTIEGLLTMTEGVEDGGPVVFRTAYTGDFTPDQLVELLAGYGPSESGHSFSYGNLPYNILGLVLDPDDGHGWKEVVRREVLDPLDMEDTSARTSDFEADEIALPHSIVPGEGWRPVALGKADANMHAAGGHFASARDLARFVAAHASGGLLDGERIFPAEAFRAAHEVQAEQDREFGPFHRFGWGYGWDLGTYEEKTIVHRFGSFPGYRSHMSFMPDHGIGVVVLVNGGGPASPAADLMATYIYDRLIGRSDLEEEYARRLADLEGRAAEGARELADHLAERRVRQSPLPHPLEAYAGTYENRELGRMEWRVAGESLEAEIGVARSIAEVFDAAEDQLRVELTGGGEVIDFEFPAGAGRGPASSLRYNDYEFVRVER